MKLLLFILFSLVLLSSKCRKEETPDPNSTYYICKVDGVEYRPNNCANCLTCTIYKDTIFLLGANKGFEAVAIGIIDPTGIKVNAYELNSRSNGGVYKNSTTTDDRYDTDSMRKGTLNVTSIDKDNKIISGTFEFLAFNPVQNKIVNVNEGKFRLKYTTN